MRCHVLIREMPIFSRMRFGFLSGFGFVHEDFEYMHTVDGVAQGL